MISFVHLAVILLLAFLIMAFIAYFKKLSVKYMIAQIKGSIAYNIIGVEAVLEDILRRKTNKVDLADESNQIAVITGGTKGIGKEVIIMLLKCNMHVIMGCRRVADGEKVRNEIRQNYTQNGDLQIFELDTSSIEKVHTFANSVKSQYSHINYLINNAGIMFAPYSETVDGYESHFATNYLGHFLLTHLLMPLLKKGGTETKYARIVNVSSCVYTYGKIKFEDINNKSMYISFEAYSQSKLAQIYFTTYLNKELSNTEKCFVQVHAVHPGVVNTDLFQHAFIKKYASWFMKLIFKAPIEGAYPIVCATISPELERRGGTYISNCRVKKLKPNATNLATETKLFAFTMKQLDIAHFGR